GPGSDPRPHPRRHPAGRAGVPGRAEPVGAEHRPRGPHGAGREGGCPMSRRHTALSALVLLAAACAPAAAPEPVAAPAPAVATRAAPFPTTPPEPGPAPSLTLPAPVRRTLPNGLQVVYVRHGT